MSLEKHNLISVIIPVHNREKYLEKCINGVLEQKDVNVEIIMVDDGSTDKSSLICDRYAEKYNNISVVHQVNQGLSKARNVGLNNANGEYIAFLDDDDNLPEDSLKMLLGIQKNTHADLVMGNYAEYSDEGEYVKTFEIPNKYCNKLLGKREVCELLLFSDRSHVLMVSWGKLFKKEVWDNLRFNENVPCAEDQFIFPELIEKCKTIYLTDKVVYNQIFTKNSIVRGGYNRRHLYHSLGITGVIDYLINKEFYDIALFKFGLGTRHLLFLKRILKDRDSQQEIKRQYQDYKKLAKKLFSHVNLKNKLRFILFFINLDLYDMIRDKAAKS